MKLHTVTKIGTSGDVNEVSKRYFVDANGQSIESNPTTVESIGANENDDQTVDEKVIIVRRPKLGALPSYIPLG